MEFAIEKCFMLVTRSGKIQITERKNMSTQEIIRTLGEKENYECRAKLEVDAI